MMVLYYGAEGLVVEEVGAGRRRIPHYIRPKMAQKMW
jgi:hypothetical protein